MWLALGRTLMRRLRHIWQPLEGFPQYTMAEGECLSEGRVDEHQDGPSPRRLSPYIGSCESRDLQVQGDHRRARVVCQPGSLRQ